jgi:DNA-binding winged helix-turn-helix (wHTH) protein
MIDLSPSAGLSPWTGPASERSFRGEGCDERCRVVKALLPGIFGRSELLVHDPIAHEEFGRRGATGLPPGGVIRTGGVEIDLGRAVVTVDGRQVVPTGTELRLLVALALRAGRVMSPDELAAAIWGTAILSTPLSAYLHALRVNVTRLRNRLFPWRGLIVCVYAVGYRLEMLAADAELPAIPASNKRSLPPDRWSIAWDACRACGLVDLPHAGNGYCSSCQETRTVRPNRGRTAGYLAALRARQMTEETS